MLERVLIVLILPAAVIAIAVAIAGAKRGWRGALKAAGITVVALITLFFVHPWLLGFPGRVQEWRFELGVRKGMTRAQVLSLMKRTGSDPNIDSNGDIEASYWDAYTICVASGTRFTVLFDDKGHAVDWFASSVGDAC